jgi:hypothetical protein
MGQNPWICSSISRAPGFEPDGWRCEPSRICSRHSWPIVLCSKSSASQAFKPGANPGWVIISWGSGLPVVPLRSTPPLLGASHPTGDFVPRIPLISAPPRRPGLGRPEQSSICSSISRASGSYPEGCRCKSYQVDQPRSVAQLAEHPALTRGVVGASPTGSIDTSWGLRAPRPHRNQAPIAQSEECCPVTAEAQGASPARSVNDAE